MADIARLAGVAVSTVSRALAGSRLVNQKTRDRILELAGSLNYTVNVGAQNLRLKQNNTVAVVVPYDSATGQNLSDPFFLSLLGSLALAITARGYEMLVSRMRVDELDQVAQPYLTGRAMGVVVLGHLDHYESLNEMALRRMPLVVWGARRTQQLFCTVGSDNVQGGLLATRHLMATGANRVAFLGDWSIPEIAQRFEGYLLAHREAGLAADPVLHRPVALVPEAVEAHVAALVQQGTVFDAIFAASDVAAMTTIGTLQRHGLQVPRDVAVVGYDDIALAAHFEPSLTTVRQPIAAAGKALMDALMAQVAGEQPEPIQLVTELVLRRTTGTPKATAKTPRAASPRRQRNA